MELLAKIVVVGGLLTTAGFCAFFCWKAAGMMQAEMEREALRKTTQAAMRYDRHMARLKRAGMKAQYRRARVW